MNAPRTLCELLEKSVESYHNPKMLNSKAGGEWKSFSSDQVYETVKNIALGLHSLGVVPGDHVALYAESSAYWTISDLGIIHAGAADIPIYVTQAVPQIEFILNNSESKGIFVGSRKLYDRAKDAVANSKCKFVISVSDEKFDSNVVTWSELLEMGKKAALQTPNLFDELKHAPQEDDLATIIYTSGTTGEPKGVMLSHRNLVSNVVDCAPLFSFTPIEETALSYLPPSHVFERMLLYLYIHVGIRIFYAESIEALPQDLIEVRPHLMTTVPRMLEKAFEKAQNVVEGLPWYKRFVFKWAIDLALQFNTEKEMPLGYRVKRAFASALVYKNLREAFGGRIGFIISGGAPLRPDLATIFCAAGMTVLQGYGLTETSPVIAVNRLERNRIGSVGPLIPNVSAKIAGDGEILIDGPNVMMGYYKNTAATSASYYTCWFKTGDIGYLDKDGFLFVTDRKKDLLKTSGGKFIAPQEIESLLSKSLYVDKAIVLGDQRKFASALIFPNWDALRGFAEKNQIEFKSNAELAENPQIKALFQGIVDGANKDLSHWETIKKFAVLDGELTIEADYLTPTLKMKRRNVENRYKDLIESFYKE
ncbi:MAG: long-chain fatty acid--CoA ligase [Bacteroidetes bacterium]|nr:long-chain fatty acid--CoA ligase [Bacteroidota bacterium]MCL5739256.1 long-chain fatty acid--CoA ligase [Bacteroidota bacterium]